MNKIHDRLYLGNIKAASDLKMLKAAVSIFLLSILNSERCLMLCFRNDAGCDARTPSCEWHQAFLPKRKYF